MLVSAQTEASSMTCYLVFKAGNVCEMASDLLSQLLLSQLSIELPSVNPMLHRDITALCMIERELHYIRDI